MEESLKWFSTLGVGGILAGMMFFVTRAQMREATDSRERLHSENVQSLKIINDRLEHIINSTRMERQATSEALLNVVKENSSVISMHTAAVNDIRDWMRSDRR